MNSKRISLPIVISMAFLLFGSFQALAQTDDVNTPLHLLEPDYPVPYGAPEEDSVKAVLDRVYSFLEENSASEMLNTRTNERITDPKKFKEDIEFEPGSFRLTSYEWGVTYAGMLLSSEVTGEDQYAEYTNKRLQLIADVAKNHKIKEVRDSPIHSVLNPGALDDAGWNDVGYNGSEIRTPNIDDLAKKNGIRLNRFYVYPTCSPF